MFRKPSVLPPKLAFDWEDDGIGGVICHMSAATLHVVEIDRAFRFRAYAYGKILGEEIYPLQEHATGAAEEWYSEHVGG